MKLGERWKIDFYFRTTIYQLGTTVAGAVVLVMFVWALAPGIVFCLGEFFVTGLIIALLSGIASLAINYRYNRAVQVFSGYVMEGKEVPPKDWAVIAQTPYVLPFRLLYQTIGFWSLNTIAIAGWLYGSEALGAADAWRLAVSGALFSPIQAFILFNLTRKSMHLMVERIEAEGRGQASGKRSPLKLRAKLVWSYLCLAVLPLVAGVMINEVQGEWSHVRAQINNACLALPKIHAYGDGTTESWYAAPAKAKEKLKLPPASRVQIADPQGAAIAGESNYEELIYLRGIYDSPRVEGKCIIRPLPAQGRFAAARFFKNPQPGVWISLTLDPYPARPGFFARWGATLGLAALMVLLGVIMGLLSAADVSNSIGVVAEAARKASRGQYEPISRQLLDDEIADLAGGFNVLIASINSELQRSRELIGSLQEAVGSMGRHSREISGMAGRKREVLEELMPLVVQASGGAEEISRAADEIKDRAFHTRGQMIEVLEKSQQADGMMEDLSATMIEIGESASTLFREIGEIELNYQRLGEVVTIIEDIAERTEMLALNASLEAVGESGERTRFSVVAGEVQRLSERISEQTTNIKTTVRQIKRSGEEMSEVVRGSRARSESGPAKVTALKESLDQVRRRAESVATSMQEIANMTDEQSRSLDDMKLMVGEMKSISEIMDQINQGSESTAQSLIAMSERLKETGGETAEN